jgi:hypothetical protein
MSGKTIQLTSGGSSRPFAKEIEDLMPLVIEVLKSVLSDKEDLINKLDCWSAIYYFISYHISVLTEKNEFNKVQSLKQLIMLDVNLALSYLVEQSKINDVTIIETFEQVFQSFSHIIYPSFMDCLLQFIENISYGGDALSRLSNLVIKLLNNGYQIESINRIVFEKIFRNMDSNEKDKFICYLIANNLISFESINIILNMESIIIDISRDTNPSIIFIDVESQQLIGRMVITDMTNFSEKILVAIIENESGGGKLKNLVSVIEILLHKKIVFNLSNVDESTFIKMINNFDDYYSIILMTKNLLNMKDNNLSFLTAKNKILREAIIRFLNINIINYDIINMQKLTEDKRKDLLIIYKFFDNSERTKLLLKYKTWCTISELEDDPKKSFSILNFEQTFFDNFNDECIRHLLLKVMNHPDHQY